jgi:predicted HicB family RNase H-like nuclease
MNNKLDGELMSNDTTNQTKNRMIHIRLSEDLHKRLRIRAAETDQTIQDWVVEALQTELNRQKKDERLR